MALEHTVNAYEPTVAQKSELNIEEKKKIAAYAASLIQPEDFVYLDAGTTTGYMLEHLNGSRATFVTNGVSHARTGPDGNPCAADRRGVERLHGSGDRKPGHADAEELSFYQGLFGTNGMTQREGFTTPEANEALVKRTAMEQCLEKYVVSDSSKFRTDQCGDVLFHLKGR